MDTADEKEKERKRKDEIAVSNWQMHHQLKIDSLRQMDNIILLLGTGAFGVSIAFVSFLKEKPIDWWILLLSWMFLLAAIICTFLAHEANVKTSLRNQVLINQWRVNGGNSIRTDEMVIDEKMDTSKDPQVQVHDRETNKRRNAAKTLLILGIVSLILFAGINFYQNQVEQNKGNPPRWYYQYPR
ncbi:hypothetical protein M1413_01725 [Patescibacteria group bacterium]|nr:hypothetical protein [Patescibacteria group bacterium]MCL5114443.1 hypothetical protein [Patescibacteria group bacterium]